MLRDVEAEIGAKFSSFLNAGGVRQKMLGYGNGSEGVVYGKRLGEAVGHFLHAVNQKGVVHLLDPQIGKVANLADYALLKFLRIK